MVVLQKKTGTVAAIGLLLLLRFFAAVTVEAAPVEVQYSYAVVVSRAAYADISWRSVADSLVRKHAHNGASKLIYWTSSVVESLDSLKTFMPDYIGFIARPATECNSTFVVAVSKLCRLLDSDPYGDAVWGVITGYEAADALRAITESLEVKTVLSASGNLSYEPPIRRFDQAIGMTCDSYTKTDYLFSGSAGTIYTENKRPQGETDRIKLVAAWLNAPSLSIAAGGKGTITGPVDCIITGGHGNVNLWQCHYPEVGSEGYMTSSKGQLGGAPASGGALGITAATPKIYWCASNCLMGNPDSKDNMVYAAFHSGHAVQMFGFINNASAGDEFMAWGTYDRVTKCAGSITLPQGFFLSNNNAQFELEHPSGQMDARLVRQFMDSTVLYGDPAGAVTFHDVGDSAHAYSSHLSFVRNSGAAATFTYTYTMTAHNLEYGEGYCYQFRPVCLLPVRIDPATVVVEKNEGHLPAITDNMLIWEMLARGEVLEKGKTRTLVWSAVITDDKTEVDRSVQRGTFATARSCTATYMRSRKQLLINQAAGSHLEYRIVSVSGRVVAQGSVSLSEAGSAAVSLGSEVPSGVFCIWLLQPKGSMALRFTVP